MALIKCFMPQMRRLFDGGVYLKVGCTKEDCFYYDTVICCIKLTELTSFDFDYNGAMAPRNMALVGAYYVFVANGVPIA